MARYTYDLVLNKPEDFVQFVMNDFLQKNRFEPADYNGEAVYRAGDRMVEGHKYLKWSYAGGVFHVEAWLKAVSGEMGLDGFVGMVQKKPFKESLEQLYAVLQQPIQAAPGQGAQAGPGMQQGAQAGPGMQQGAQAGPGPQPVPVYTVDNSKSATMAMVFGILSIIAGLILGILGVTRARMGAGSSMAGRAKIGKVCSIVGIVVAILMWALNFFVMFA